MTNLIEASAAYGLQPVTAEKTKTWFNVACNAGVFVVAAENEQTILAELEIGLQVPAAYKYERAEPLVIKSLGHILGLPEVNPSTIVAELVNDTLANHFDQIGHPAVTYSGMNTPQA